MDKRQQAKELYLALTTHWVDEIYDAKQDLGKIYNTDDESVIEEKYKDLCEMVIGFRRSAVDLIENVFSDQVVGTFLDVMNYCIKVDQKTES